MVLERVALDRKVAVVTGAAQGIGFAIASAMGEARASVVVLDLNGQAAGAAAGQLRSRGFTQTPGSLDGGYTCW